jgi:acetyl-CoA synthase
MSDLDVFTAAEMAEETEVRRRGIGLIDGSLPGYVLLMGDDANAAATLLAELQRKKILVFVVDEALRGLATGWDSGVVSYDLPQALGFVTRVAQVFGASDGREQVLAYARQRLKGFTLLLGEPAPARLAGAQAALPLGCPLLSPTDLPSSLADWLIPAISGVSLADIVQRGIEERGLQIHVPMPALPVTYSPDFSGQVVRDESCGVCLSGVELTVTGSGLEDGGVTVIGPDLDAVSGDQAFALLVEVSGRALESDFEPVLERQIETILNDADGVVHRGQRAMVTLRISQKAIARGLRFRHLGEILHARLHNEFGNILSRVQITIVTDPGRVQGIRERALAIYRRRDDRLSRLTDEDVDTFYTCNLCQTIAAGHLCIISPEHPGACGAVDWMDARAAVSIRPVGPNRAVAKEGLIDANLGQWQSVNRIVAQESGGALEAYSLYSLMQDPGTACGDFECITAMLPLANGVMVMAHDYTGMTPSGMDWEMLYEMVGAGMPVPGFLGHSKRALHRDKFIAAEGGWRRIVWMNHALREELRPALEALAEAAGMPGFVDRIATEQDALDEEEILARMEVMEHPASMMEPMM